MNKPSILPLLLAIAALTSLPVSAQPSAPGTPPPPAFRSPPVSDPMLAPPPPAPHQVRSWDEAIVEPRRTSATAAEPAFPRCGTTDGVTGR